jgi:hypothetical protein
MKQSTLSFQPITADAAQQQRKSIAEQWVREHPDRVVSAAMHRSARPRQAGRPRIKRPLNLEQEAAEQPTVQKLYAQASTQTGLARLTSATRCGRQITLFHVSRSELLNKNRSVCGSLRPNAPSNLCPVRHYALCPVSEARIEPASPQ